MKLIKLLIFLFGTGLIAQNSEFNPLTDSGKLYQHADLINVGPKKYSIKEFQAQESSLEDFQTLDSENHSVGFTTDYYWLRFKLVNSTDHIQTYYLETARPVTDLVDLYQTNSSEVLKFQSGDQINFNDRQVLHRSSVFKIELPPHQLQQFYLNLKSDGETFNLPLNLYTEGQFWAINYQQQMFLGLFYGLLLLAGIIYLFFYGSLKAKSFLYYGIYVFSVALLQSSLDGLIFQYIFPNGGFWNDKMVLISALVANYFLLKYCQHFLNVRKQLPLYYMGYQLVYGAIFVLMIMALITPSSMVFVYPLSNINGMLSLLLVVGTVIGMKYKQMPVDNFFSIGILCLVIGLLGFVLNNLSLLPNNFYTLNSAKFGTGLEVIFLSLSMTNLIRKLRVEKDLSQEVALQKSEEISELKTYFMSNMSHELRTPINVIMGIANSQLEDLPHGPQKENFELIKTASLSLLNNINDILDFGSIEKNELSLQNEIFNPSKVINDLNSEWKQQAEAKNLTYTSAVDAKLPQWVNGDPQRFKKILNNVIGNAVKFTSEGSVKLNCTFEEISKNKIALNFEIVDTGIGMDIEIQNTVFDSFNQMRRDHKRQFGGVGLGLTIVNQLIELFQGTMTIESAKELGTKISIRVPLELAKKHAPYPAIASAENSLPDLRILIVEDNMMNQLIMKKILSKSSNIDYVTVNDGQQALDQLKQSSFDIILMDLQMPVMDGYEATKVIRSGKLGNTVRNIPIIAVTADAMQETNKRVLEIGMNDYMTKPIDKSILMDKIYKHREIKLKIA